MTESLIIDLLRKKFATLDHVARLALAYELFGRQGRDIVAFLDGKCDG